MKEGRREYKGFSSESRFSAEAFSSPALEYAPIYTWMWDGKITNEETDRQLEEFQRLGIRRIYILPMPKSFRPTSFPTPLEPEYLSDGYFKAYRHAICRAKELGMGLWLYDEGGWPSGGACGQVVLEDPGLTQESIRIAERRIEKGEIYLKSETAEVAFLFGKKILPGTRAKEGGVLNEYLRVKTSFPSVNSADYPDVTKEKTTPLFLSLTADAYEGALQEDLFKADALFTDEPTAPRPFPYTDEIKNLFKSRFGKEIEDCLPFLMGKEPLTDKTAQIKLGFFKMLSDLFINRFLKKEKAWANERSLALVGHLDKDDETASALTSGSFGILSALRVFDVPGVDAIRRQIFPPKGKTEKYGKNAFYPLLAASAAAQTGGRHALTESFAVYGEGISYDEMRYVLNFQAMCGINVFNIMLTPYEKRGYHLAGLLPHFTEKTTPDLSLFNRYAERLSYLFSLGERVANVALYMPDADVLLGEKGEQASLSYESLGRELMSRRIPFDLVDDDFFSFATITKRGSLLSNKAEYDVVVVPNVSYLPQETEQALLRLIKAGGRVLTSSSVVFEKVAGATLCADLSSLSSPLKLNESGVLLSFSKTAGGDLFFLMNETGEEKTVTVPTDLPLYVITPTDGKIRRAEKDAELTIPLSSGEILALLYTEDILPASPFPKKGECECKIQNWVFRPLSRLVLGDTYQTEEYSEESLPIVLGDWAPRLGAHFSGEGEYHASFCLEQNVRNATLDLGKVCRVAKVLINGVLLGTRVMPPYRFELPEGLLQKENEIVVRVRNGAANEFEGTSAFESYYPKQLGNYLKEERLFHKDSLESGLFGEVKITYRTAKQE